MKINFKPIYLFALVAVLFLSGCGGEESSSFEVAEKILAKYPEAELKQTYRTFRSYPLFYVRKKNGEVVFIAGDHNNDLIEELVIFPSKMGRTL